MDKRGAKGKYDKDTFPLLAEGYARSGLSDKQIAGNLQISLYTYYIYKKKYIEFSEAIKRGKAPVDFEVENALLKRALGYSYEERTVETEVDKITGEGKNTKVKITTKHVPGDVGAQAFWLKNRKPSVYKDKHNVVIEEDDDTLKTREEFLLRMRRVCEVRDEQPDGNIQKEEE